MEAAWDFSLACGLCDERWDARIPDASIRRLSSGGFAPLRCRACGAFSARPTARPWAPGLNDRTFLRKLRITGD